MSRQIPASILARYPRFSELPQDVVDSAIANAEDSRNFMEAGVLNYSFEKEQKLVVDFLLDELKSYDKKRVIKLIPAQMLARMPRFAELDYATVREILSGASDSRHSFGLETRSAEIKNEVILSGLLHALNELDKQKLNELEGKQKP